MFAKHQPGETWAIGSSPITSANYTKEYMYYESHHTFDVPQLQAGLAFDVEAQLKYIAEDHGMKFSKIDGDPLLGDKVYGYITCHTPTEAMMWERWKFLELDLNFSDLRFIRRKIEHVIFDERREQQDCGVMVAAADLKSAGHKGREGSSPSFPTKQQ